MQCLLTVILLAFCWRPRLRRLLVVNLLVPWWLRLGPLKPKRTAWQRRRRAKVQFDVAGCQTQGALPPRKKPAWVLAEVLRLAAHLRTSRAIACHFNRLHGQRMTVGKTWVHARCRENAEAIAAMRRGVKGKPPRIVPAKLEWGLDLTLIRTSDGNQHPTIAIIDHGSRALLRIQVLTRKCTWTLLAEFCAACAEHGAPDAVRTDNEAMFTSRLWASFFKIAGIKRQRIEPGCPWQNGRIERLFGTLKPLLRQLTIPTASALQARLNEFAHFYNHVRVHQSLDGLTPAEAWSGQDLNAVRRRYGQGPWVQALDGLMLGYWLRC
jgi:transposase InsO family protein